MHTQKLTLHPIAPQKHCQTFAVFCGATLVFASIPWQMAAYARRKLKRPNSSRNQFQEDAWLRHCIPASKIMWFFEPKKKKGCGHMTAPWWDFMSCNACLAEFSCAFMLWQNMQRDTALTVHISQNMMPPVQYCNNTWVPNKSSP